MLGRAVTPGYPKMPDTFVVAELQAAKDAFDLKQAPAFRIAETGLERDELVTEAAREREHLVEQRLAFVQRDKRQLELQRRDRAQRGSGARKHALLEALCVDLEVHPVIRSRERGKHRVQRPDL